MGSAEFHNPRTNKFLCLVHFTGGAFVVLFATWTLWSFINPNATPSDDLERPTFYDYPEMSYSVEKPMKNWDEKRRHWQKLNDENHQRRSVLMGRENEGILILTGSQTLACKNPIGDNLLLRAFKNKVDYARINGYEIFYNNVLLHPNMTSFWAKLPLVRAAMLSHPNTEWIWWIDSDAIFTDMFFKLPLDKYKDYNLIVHGWGDLIFGPNNNKSWTALNAGVFLIRNCQWSMDFLTRWAEMGPQSPYADYWGEVQMSTFNDKMFPGSDDQSAMIYLISKEEAKWADKVYLENEYYFQGYWVGIVKELEEISDKYEEMEKTRRDLRRRHAEKVSVSDRYGLLWEQVLKDNRIEHRPHTLSRPFITHFTGCQPCNGDYNPEYTAEECWGGMSKALTFADNQVLRNYGYVHHDLRDPSSVSLVPFAYPAAAA